MAISEKLLNDGEHVVVSTRTHVKAMFVPFAVLLLTVFGAFFLAAVVHNKIDNANARKVLDIALAVVALVLIVGWFVRPFVRWYTTTYTFTNRRFIERSGFVAKEGRTIPLNRISGVDFEMSVLDRIFGCGTLVVSDASENGRVPLNDIPKIEQVQTRIAEELHRISNRGRNDDGT